MPFAALAAAFLLLRTADSDPQAMMEKYTNAASQFAENEEGLRVHFRDQGNPNGPPLILIHGTSASLHTWEPLVERLGGEYRVITYSQPGHGLTGPHPRDDYSFAGMAEALDLVTDALDLDRFALAGNSMGGWVAWRYALRHPDKIDALILLDASGMPLRDGEREPPMNIGFKLLGTPLGRLILKNYTPRFLIEKSARDSVSVKEIMTNDAIVRYWELMRYPGNRNAAALIASVDRETGYADRVSEINAPTLLIWGAEDQLVYASAARSFDERLPNAEIVIYENVGHLPMEEAPDRTARDIDAFLDRALDREN